MSAQELKRAGVLARVVAETLTLRGASVLMGVSYRQAKRLVGRYRAQGAAGLRHGSAGRVSNRATTARVQTRVLALVRRSTAAGSTSGLGRRWRPSISRVKTG
jgi:transposase